MADSYFPTLAKLEGLIDRYFGSPLADRLAGMVQAFNDAYGPWDIPPGLIQALTDAYQQGLRRHAAERTRSRPRTAMSTRRPT